MCDIRIDLIAIEMTDMKFAFTIDIVERKSNSDAFSLSRHHNIYERFSMKLCLTGYVYVLSLVEIVNRKRWKINEVH